MEIKKNIMVLSTELEDVICDCCGKSCCAAEFDGDDGKKHKVFEYMSIDKRWGYYSKDKDLQRWSAQICEQCVDEKFTFIKFKKEKYRL